MSTQSQQNLIIGLGNTGASVARYLSARGESFSVADTRLTPPGLEALKNCAPEAELRCGALAPDWLSSFRRLIVSPGVSIAESAIQAAARAGSEVLGDIELFAREVKQPVIAITGSNGKSTVTTVVGEMARATGIKVGVGGNLGTPALDLLLAGDADMFVLELSSFQLETTYSLRPAAAAVLNLAPDHLDRYPGLAEYARAKARIFNGARCAVFNREDALVSAMQRGDTSISFGLDAPEPGHFGLLRIGGVDWLAFGDRPLLSESQLHIAGRHNIANALAALALAHAVGLPFEPSIAALAGFRGLPHRCRWVASYRGVNWYNDSKGTNLGSTLAALSGLPGKVVLIAGGLGKGQDFSPLADVARHKARAVVLMGRDALIIEQALGGVVPVVHVRSMEEAVQEASRIAQGKDSVLLSPACASFDMFQGYEHRGEVFEAAVGRLGS